MKPHKQPCSETCRPHVPREPLGQSLSQSCGRGRGTPPQQGTAAALSALLSRSILAAAVASGDKGRSPGSGAGGQTSVHIPRAQAKPLTRDQPQTHPGAAGRPCPGGGQTQRCAAGHEGWGRVSLLSAGPAGGKGGARAVRWPTCSGHTDTRALWGRSPGPCFAAQGTRLYTLQQSGPEKNSVKNRHRHTCN